MPAIELGHPVPEPLQRLAAHVPIAQAAQAVLLPRMRFEGRGAGRLATGAPDQFFQLEQDARPLLMVPVAAGGGRPPGASAVRPGTCADGPGWDAARAGPSFVRFREPGVCLEI